MTTKLHPEKVQISVPGESRPMPAYLAVPEGAGPKPAVIVFEEIFGVNGHIRDVTERVAREGYVAIAPDIHHRAAPGQELAYDQEGMQKGMQLIPKMTVGGVEADANATLAFLRARADVRGDRIGTIGFCIGGHVAYLIAALTDVRASASFYPGGVAGAHGLAGGPSPVSLSGQIRGRLLAFFGGQDKSIEPAQVAKVKAALAEHQIRHEVVVYEDAGHGFFCDQRGSYNAKDAADAWERVKRLFAEELK
jgi:carboxymethylenebutenolidase